MTTGMRNASIDLEAVGDCGVTVAVQTVCLRHRGVTWGLILSLFRKVSTEDAATRRGARQVTIGEGLHGKILGLLGLGRLGSQVARVGGAFGMRLAAWSQNLTADRAAEYGADLVPKEELMSTSGRRVNSPRVEQPDARPDRRRRAISDEAFRIPGEHVARSDCRRGRTDRRTSQRDNRRSRT